jgi:hypothetical protein
MSEWRTIAEWDWVEFTRGSVLHAPASVKYLSRFRRGAADGMTECGREGRMFIPPLGARFSTRRCRVCCMRTGMPMGDGSPKNSDGCREIVEARLAALNANPRPVREDV